MRPTLVLIPVLLGACLTSDEAPPGLGESVSELGAQPASRNLDLPLPAPGGHHELDMFPGRINKVPVSWFYRGTISPGLGHHLQVRTIGCTGTADTAIIVTWTEGTGVFAEPFTAFANDGQPGDNGRCTLLDVGGQPGPMTYDVYVVSMNRATSHATLQFSLNGGATWQDKATEHFGGTLVGVGPLQPADFIEVLTETDGAAVLPPQPGVPPIIGYEGTQMLLFHPPPAGIQVHGHPAIFRSAGSDGDPRIDVGAGWTARDNVVLIGKDTRSTSSKRGVEVTVDLVRGPLSKALDATPPLICSGETCTSDEVVLPAGRYTVAVSARGLPVGHGGDHSAKELGQWQSESPDPVFENGQWHNGATPEYCADEARGQGNSLAFVAQLIRGVRWSTTRVVPRGLLGADPADGPFSQVHFEVESDGVRPFKIELSQVAPDIEVEPFLRIQRNRQTNEVKIASWNFAYWALEDDSSSRAAALDNGVDVLATRGEISPATLSITENLNQAPWQWDADVVMFQEFWLNTHDGVVDRLAARSPFTWAFVNGMTEDSLYPFGSTQFYGPVFTSDPVQPPEGPEYSHDQLAGSLCNQLESGGQDFTCYMGQVGRIFTTFTNYAVPSKIAARRQVGKGTVDQDVPIALFNWHLFHESGAFDARASNVAWLRNSIQSLIERPADGDFPAAACAFNKDCNPDLKDPGNRIILIGDSNMSNNKCGEFTWTLRKLREEFGYAIDVSAAAVDDTGRTFDQHYSGASLLDPDTGTYGDCRDPDWARTPHDDGTSTGCPFQFQSVEDWNADRDFTLDSWFPWWAASFGDVDGGDRLTERYDVIFLVGLGWASDDPVLSYKVMPNRDEPSPMSAGAGGGVESRWDKGCDGNVSDEPPDPDALQSYVPVQPVSGCGLDAGAAALRSDHAPIGVRLRVTD